MYKRLISSSANIEYLEKGTTPHPTKLTINVKIGAKINKRVFALLGKTNSFTNNLSPSASGCNKP